MVDGEKQQLGALDVIDIRWSGLGAHRLSDPLAD